jgi:hypothetical protein
MHSASPSGEFFAITLRKATVSKGSPSDRMARRLKRLRAELKLLFLPEKP